MTTTGTPAVRVDAAAQAAERRVVAEQRRGAGATEGEDAARRDRRDRRLQRSLIAGARRRASAVRGDERAGPRAARGPARREPTPIARSMLSSSCCCCGSAASSGSATTSQSAGRDPAARVVAFVGTARARRRGRAGCGDAAGVGARRGALAGRRDDGACLDAGRRAPARRDLVSAGVGAASGSPEADAHLAQHRALTLSPAHRQLRSPSRDVQAHDDGVLAPAFGRRVVALAAPDRGEAEPPIGVARLGIALAHLEPEPRRPARRHMPRPARRAGAGHGRAAAPPARR